MSAADPYIHEEAAICYREELATEIVTFALHCRNERVAREAQQLAHLVENRSVSLLFGEQELAMLEYNYACDGLDYGDIPFREGAD